MTSNLGNPDVIRGAPVTRVQFGPTGSPVTAAQTLIESYSKNAHELGLSTPHCISRFSSPSGFLGSAIVHSYHPAFPADINAVLPHHSVSGHLISGSAANPPEVLLAAQHTSGWSTPAA